MITPSIIYLLEKSVILALFAWNVLLFTRAVRNGFARPNGVPSLMRVMGICAAITATVNVLYLYLLNSIPTPRLISSLTALVVGHMIFHSASLSTRERQLSLAFSDDPPAHLNHTGPYRWIRHPFYTSYLLTWIGGALATAHILSIVAVVGMAGFYYFAAAREESKFLNSPLAPNYQRYKQSTGMFFPRLTDHSLRN